MRKVEKSERQEDERGRALGRTTVYHAHKRCHLRCHIFAAAAAFGAAAAFCATRLLLVRRPAGHGTHTFFALLRLLLLGCRCLLRCPACMADLEAYHHLPLLLPAGARGCLLRGAYTLLPNRGSRGVDTTPHRPLHYYTVHRTFMNLHVNVCPL